MTLRYGGLDKNFRFAVIEVTKQVERTYRFLSDPNPRMISQIARRDDYIDHLKSTIQTKIYTFLRRYGDIDKKTVDHVRSLNIITVNLERMGDFAVNITRQTTHLTEPAFLERYDYHPHFQAVIAALRLVVDAFQDNDATKAIQICEAEGRLDELYRVAFDRILRDLTTAAEEARNLVTTLFIFHYLERMGDCLLNIGEAIILSRMGDRLKIRQFQSLRETVASSHDRPEPPGKIGFEGINDTRGGVRVGKVIERAEETAEPQEVIYKEGDLEKIRREKDKIELWGELVPDLPPRVLEYQEYDDNAALLIEFLEGSTFQEIVLNPGAAPIREAVSRIQEAVHDVWTRTKKPGLHPSRFMDELSRITEDVYKVHPHFAGVRKRIGGVEIPDFGDLLARNLHLDDELPAPFVVFAHGDFNLDNIIYNPDTKRVHFIDLHRSDYMDYTRDVAVFMVSNFRLPVFEPAVREHLNETVASFFEFALGFAGEHADATFEARLALGLIQSFITSTRFELDNDFADDMLSRAVYLLEQMEAHAPKAWDKYKLPRDIMFY